MWSIKGLKLKQLQYQIGQYEYDLWGFRIGHKKWEIHLYYMSNISKQIFWSPNANWFDWTVKSYVKDRTHFYLTIYEVDTIQQHLKLSSARVHFEHAVMDGHHLPVLKNALR